MSPRLAFRSDLVTWPGRLLGRRQWGLAIQLRPTRLSWGEQQSAEVTAVDSEQQLPTLWHDGFALAEASAIMHFLADCAGRLDDWFGASPRAYACPPIALLGSHPLCAAASPKRISWRCC